MGEPSILIGVLLLGAAWSISKAYNFTPLGVYGAMAGLVAIVVGYQVIDLGLGANPLPTGIALICAAVPGVLALPATFFARSKPGACPSGSMGRYNPAGTGCRYAGLHQYKWIYLAPGQLQELHSDLCTVIDNLSQND